MNCSSHFRVDCAEFDRIPDALLGCIVVTELLVDDRQDHLLDVNESVFILVGILAFATHVGVGPVLERCALISVFPHREVVGTSCCDDLPVKIPKLDAFVLVRVDDELVDDFVSFGNG